MALFHFEKKNKEEKKTVSGVCHCDCAASEEKSDLSGSGFQAKADRNVSMKVLGAGCKSCHEQYENAKQAVKDIGLSIEVDYITDMKKIMEYGVMSMPAIVVNEQVVATGKVLKPNDVIALLRKSGF